MALKLWILVCTFTMLSNNKIMQRDKYTMLCLGDSYTIGEKVTQQERFPMQAVEILHKQGINFTKPDIVAQTGWTTDELAKAIDLSTLHGTYDYVTLLIGVNNQYRGRDTENYKEEFNLLLHTAIMYTNGNPKHVIVVSIPDWGVTPFAADDKRSAFEIGKQIDAYNAINKEEALQKGVHYIDITVASREAKKDHTLLADDGLHPSGKMYTYWATQVAETIQQQMNTDK